MRLCDYAPRPAHLKWLLDSDPAIRWQVLCDLTDASPDAIAAEGVSLSRQPEAKDHADRWAQGGVRTRSEDAFGTRM